MKSLSTLGMLFTYSDDMNRRLLEAAVPLAAEPLDRPFDMGIGSLRKTLAHILVAETVWLERQRGRSETPWPPYETSQSPAEMRVAFEALWPRRDAFLATLDDVTLSAEQPYRDSKGNRFVATLHEMLVQGIVHSAHHRAQAVNMLRCVGGPIVEVDFMYSRRRPAL